MKPASALALIAGLALQLVGCATWGNVFSETKRSLDAGKCQFGGQSQFDLAANGAVLGTTGCIVAGPLEIDGYEGTIQQLVVTEVWAKLQKESYQPSEVVGMEFDANLAGLPHSVSDKLRARSQVPDRLRVHYERPPSRNGYAPRTSPTAGPYYLLITIPAQGQVVAASFGCRGFDPQTTCDAIALD